MAGQREHFAKERLFPGVQTFSPSGGGYASLPIVMRAAQFLFQPREWQVYTYVLMRAGPSGLTWFSMEEMKFELNFSSTAKLKRYISTLEEGGWILSKTTAGKNYYFIVNPYVVLARRSKEWPKERQDALSELLGMLKKELPSESSATGIVPAE